MDNKKPLAGLMVLTSFLSALAGGAILGGNMAYYCESRDLLCLGDRLSSTGKTCYYSVDGEEKRAVCTEGWTVADTGIQKPGESIEIFGNGCLHTCEYQDTLKTYDACTCENGQFAYAGELI
jgi:hypothetical protein